MTGTKRSEGLAQKKKNIRVYRILGFLVLVHIIFFAYPVLRICSWLQLGPYMSFFLGLPVILSQALTRSLTKIVNNKGTRILRHLADFFMGISPMLLFSVICSELLLGSGLIEAHQAVLYSLCFSCSIGLIGIYKASFPIIKRIGLDSDKIRTNLRFVQISDVHIGSRSIKFLKSVIAQIKKLDPEFLAITGDFIDSSGIEVNSLVALKELSCPIYFVIGNHERYEDLEQILDRLASLGVIILRSTYCYPREDIQVIGIDDKDDPMQVEKELTSLEVDQNDFSILMYHRPIGFESAQKAGVDLMISGHTHNGQIFPFNLVVKSVFRYLAGLYRGTKGDLYVSQGTGTWGPTMRIGSVAEITLFSIRKA